MCRLCWTLPAVALTNQTVAVLVRQRLWRRRGLHLFFCIRSGDPEILFLDGLWGEENDERGSAHLTTCANSFLMGGVAPPPSIFFTTAISRTIASCTSCCSLPWKRNAVSRAGVHRVCPSPQQQADLVPATRSLETIVQFYVYLSYLVSMILTRILASQG